MGLLHLRVTFFSDKLFPRNKKLVDEMSVSPLILTKKLTMWNSWVGFNATHSSGAIFIGIINLYLAVTYFDMLRSDRFIPVFTILTVGFYVWVAKRYWFDVVLVGIITAWICFISSYSLVLIDK
ncbi:LIC_13387 family protein [Spirosoma arcticum]